MRFSNVISIYINRNRANQYCGLIVYTNACSFYPRILVDTAIGCVGPNITNAKFRSRVFNPFPRVLPFE